MKTNDALKSFYRILGIMAAVYLCSKIGDEWFFVYDRIPWLDIPMHFFGGLLASLLGFALYRYRMTSHLNQSKLNGRWFEFLFIISFTMLIAVLWEFHEFLSDWYTKGLQELLRPMQPSLADTMKDLFMGMLGGVVGWMYGTRKL